MLRTKIYLPMDLPVNSYFTKLTHDRFSLCSSHQLQVVGGRLNNVPLS